MDRVRSRVSDATLRAYREAIYRVDDETPFRLVLDQPCAELAALYARHGVSSAAFLTAFNPVGRRLIWQRNAVLQDQLRSDLAALGVPIIEGIGLDSQEQWPGEPSFLALGIGHDEAAALGTKYRQNAILLAGSDAVPVLKVLR